VDSQSKTAAQKSESTFADSSPEKSLIEGLPRKAYFGFWDRFSLTIDSHEVAKQRVEDHLERYRAENPQGDWPIFIDGSLMNRDQAGCGFV
jgi:hypothetical protein